MNKRLRFMVCILLCVIMTSGCTGDNNFSQKEEEVIADSMAQIVFKHTKGYNYRLEDVSKNPFIREEIDEAEGTVEELLDKEINDSKDDDKKLNNDASAEEVSGDKEQEKEQEKEQTTLGQALLFDKNIILLIFDKIFANKFIYPSLKN